MESVLRDSLHKAASNALSFAISKFQSSEITHETIKLAQDYLRNNNPDAVNQLNLDDRKLNDIILSKANSFSNYSDNSTTKNEIANNIIKN
ncbi:hypothetical protein GY664_00980 [Candidatus Liberibacter brunswickensis]